MYTYLCMYVYVYVHAARVFRDANLEEEGRIPMGGKRDAR